MIQRFTPEGRSLTEQFIRGLAEKYPLAAKLAQWDIKQPNRAGSTQHRRHEVVSEELCNDALKILGPSLEKHRGCTIFDLSPGTGMWSRKIHDFLRPKQHFLIERWRERYQNEFLDSLVQDQQSTFKYFGKFIGNDFQLPGYLMREVYECAEEHLSTSEPSSAEPPVLVLANIAQGKHKVTVGSHLGFQKSWVEPSMFNFLLWLTWGRGPHLNGPARLLVWTFDEDKTNILPRNVVYRRGTALAMEGAYTIQEVVGGKRHSSQRRRAEADIESALRTARRTLDLGINVPERRRSDLSKLAIEAVEKESEPDIVSQDINLSRKPNNIREDLITLRSLERAFHEGRFARYQKLPAGADKRKRAVTGHEYAAMEDIRRKFSFLIHDGDIVGKQGDDMDKLILICSDLNQCERDYVFKVNAGADSSAEQERMTRLLAESEELWHTMQTRDKSARVTTDTDNIEALKCDPPLLAWDQRTFEPLETSVEEFWPQQKLALLDLQPRPETQAGKTRSHDEPPMKSLKQLTNLPIEAATEGIAHGASAALLPNSPTLRNPLEGGRLHLGNLRVRMITHKMIEELSQAWENWDLRPTNARPYLLSRGPDMKIDKQDEFGMQSTRAGDNFQ